MPSAVALEQNHGEMVRIIKSPSFPQLRFEWHPGKQKVYVVRIGQRPEIGEVFAHEINNEGSAQSAVLIWLRGYRAAQGHVWNDGGKLIDRRN